jgi:hypothetical protein
VELGSWLSVARLLVWLPWSIDQQLRRDAKLGMVEYQALAMLSRSPEQTMRMSAGRPSVEPRPPSWQPNPLT